MLKKLSNMDRAEMELDSHFAGKLWAFTAVMHGSFWALGIAVANEPGYSPVPVSRCWGESYAAMDAHADELNKEWLKLDDEAAMRIVCSSIAAGKVAPAEVAEGAAL